MYTRHQDLFLLFQAIAYYQVPNPIYLSFLKNLKNHSYSLDVADSHINIGCCLWNMIKDSWQSLQADRDRGTLLDRSAHSLVLPNPTSPIILWPQEQQGGGQQEANEPQQGWSEATDRAVLFEPRGDDISSMTGGITQHINHPCVFPTTSPGSTWRIWGVDYGLMDGWVIRVWAFHLHMLKVKIVGVWKDGKGNICYTHTHQPWPLCPWWLPRYTSCFGTVPFHRAYSDVAKANQRWKSNSDSGTNLN